MVARGTEGHGREGKKRLKWEEREKGSSPYHQFLAVPLCPDAGAESHVTGGTGSGSKSD